MNAYTVTATDLLPGQTVLVDVRETASWATIGQRVIQVGGMTASESFDAISATGSVLIARFGTEVTQ